MCTQDPSLALQCDVNDKEINKAEGPFIPVWENQQTRIPLDPWA